MDAVIVSQHSFHLWKFRFMKIQVYLGSVSIFKNSVAKNRYGIENF